jgi:hypothetical protein
MERSGIRTSSTHRRPWRSSTAVAAASSPAAVTVPWNSSGSGYAVRPNTRYRSTAGYSGATTGMTAARGTTNISCQRRSSYIM